MLKKFNKLWLLSLAVFAALVIIIVLTGRFLHSSYLPLLLLPLTLLGMYYYPSLRKPVQWAYISFLVALITLFSFSLFQSIKANIDNPREWDFVGFWLHGTTAVQQHNFYDPQYAQQLARNMPLSEEFQHEIVDVGFWYPPPAIFLFLPLGWFNLQSASLVWNIAQVIVLVVCVVLLWKTFIGQTGLRGLLFIGALLIMLQPTVGTFFFAQTNFVAMLWFILFWRDRNRPRSGIWFALAVITKPYMAFLGLYLLVRGRRRTIWVSVSTAAVLCLFSILAFGNNAFFSYFTSNPMSRLPSLVYSEADNQSLLALILRTTQYDISIHSPYSNPLFIVLAITLTAFTGWLIYYADDKDSEWGIVFALLLGLILYPTIGNHYLIQLMILFLMLWVNIDHLPGKQWAVVAFFTVIYVLLEKSVGLSTFLGIVLCWLTIMGIMISASKHKWVFQPPYLKQPI